MARVMVTMTALAVAVVAVLSLSVTPVTAAPTIVPSLDGMAPSVPYNESLAKLLTLYSAAAYSDNPQRCPKAWPSTFKLVNTISAMFQGQNIFGYIGVDQYNKQIVLAFRGSVNAGQLIQELTLSAPMDYPGKPGLLVLHYFLAASQLLTSQTRTSVQQMVQLYPGYTVLITGHSLGGALAILAAYDLVDQGIVARPLVYTLGQPRTGNYRFAQAVMSSVPDMYRLTHYRDIVAHLPPCNTTFDLSKLASVCTAGDPNRGLWNYHHSTEVWYPQDLMPSVFNYVSGQFKQCYGTPVGEDNACSDGLTFTTSIDNHRNYFNISVGTFCPDSVMNLPPILGGDRQQYDWNEAFKSFH